MKRLPFIAAYWREMLPSIVDWEMARQRAESEIDRDIIERAEKRKRGLAP